VDFLNFVVALPPAVARVQYARMRLRQKLEDIVGPDEETMVHVVAGVDVDVAAVAKRYAGARPSVAHYGRAFVAADSDALVETLAREAGDFCCVPSMDDPIVTVIDRVLALPAGFRFLRGQALARFRPKRRARLQAGWPRFLAKLGGPEGAAASLAPYLSQHGELAGTVEIIEAISSTLASCSPEQDLLVCACAT
jgi:hypothetical protein